MSRIIKIILILLAAFAVTLLMIWLIGRGKAERAGKTPLTFRQFLGLSTKTNTAQTVPGQTSSTFTGNGTTTTGNNTGANGTGSGTSTIGQDSTADSNVQISDFTNSGINPVGGSNNPSNSSSGNNNSSGDSSSSDNTDNSSANGNIGDATDTTSTAQVCSDEDTNIDFTPDELAQLNELQNRFYALAQTLHTNADVDTELANHDAFAVKAEQVTELYGYCEAKLPLITDPRLQQHVPTPFWHDSNTDSLSFINFSALDAAHLTTVHDTDAGDPNNKDLSGISGPYGVLNFSNPTNVPVTGSILTGGGSSFNGQLLNQRPADLQLLLPVIEKILRINLW